VHYQKCCTKVPSTLQSIAKQAVKIDERQINAISSILF